MSTNVQADRSLSIMTPLGKDALLLTRLSGREAISELFRYELELIAENARTVPFDALLGQAIAVLITTDEGSQERRFVQGICSRVSQGERDDHFTTYRMEVVPAFWFLTRRVQSRIFQHMSVPDILREVLQGLDVQFQIQGTFHPRDYCAQYQESDFHFASRLMEEEGIFYFFRHTNDGHTLVLANTPSSHPDITGGPEELIFEEVLGGQREETRILRWEKRQELRSGKYTLWDHCFELPHQHLDAEKPIQETVETGHVTQKLKIGQNDRLEIYEYPGAYAQRFDGIDKGGGERPADVDRIFEDNQRTVGIRMQQEALPGLVVQGESNCRHLVAGHKFSLTRHFAADGEYVLTGVTHSAVLEGDYRSGGSTTVKYQNSFTCIPIGLPYRPGRNTPRPIVTGPQTAVVVGPAGEEIFTDKYSRVKVQFHWDREGQNNVDSSCWVRVATPWAGKTWGMIHIPRIGQEVVVAFEHGDPDRPIIVGSVYNADMMPPFSLPDGKVISGVKSNSTPGGGGYNELVFDDTKGKELIRVHAQYDMDATVEHDDRQTVHNNRTIQVDGTHTETIVKETKITVTKGTYSHDVAANTASYHVKGALTEAYDATQTTTVKDAISIQSTTSEITITAKTKISLLCGSSSIVLNQDGTIEIHGKVVTITGDNELNGSSKKVSLAGTQELLAGVGTQTLKTDPAKTTVSGSMVAVSATGTNEITGALVKIN